MKSHQLLASIPFGWLSLPMFLLGFIFKTGPVFVAAFTSCTAYYTIQPGDTCFDISSSQGVIQNDLFNLNHGINCSALQIGQKLCIAGPLDESSCSKLYAVKEGDSCLSVSEASSLTIQDFMFINPRLNCSSLQQGQQACVAPCLKYALPARHGDPENHKKEQHVLIDYIGAIGPIRFQDVPVRDDVQQYFILAFAIDANSLGIYQNGSFSKYWVSSISPEAIASVKSAHPKVRVLMSLSGYSLYIQSTGQTQVLNWYDPKDAKTWLANAVHSITSFVRQYHLDGIDIDYETFPQSKTFPFLIGELIKTLKQNKVISLATMAPYESVATHYRKLYAHYSRFFDLVNYQFYANNFSTVAEYVGGYNKVATWFPRRKLMASLEVGPTARGPTADIFFEAFSRIVGNDEEQKNEGRVPGLFLWAADHSKREGFLVEKVAQCKL